VAVAESGTWRLRWPLYVGMSVAGTAAVVASASTLADLAQTAGWSDWTPWLLPAAVDIGGSAGGWCWLRPGIPQRARRFGRVVALSGAAASLIGNACGHLMASGYLVAGPVLVVVVGATPAIVLVALAHLAALLSDAGQDPPGPVPDPDPPSHPGIDSGAAVDEITYPVIYHAGPEAEPDSEPDPDPDPEPVEESAGSRAASQSTREVVMDLIVSRPHSVAELAQATGRSRTTVNGHLRALVRRGQVVRDQDRRYRARPHLITSAGDEGEPR